MTESVSRGSYATVCVAGGVLLTDVALVVAIIVMDLNHHVEPPNAGSVDKSAIIGWLGVAAAIVIFGNYGVLIKSPSVAKAKVHGMVFQVYYSIGVVIVSLLIWVIAGHAFSFTWLGMLAAAFWITSQVFAFNAIRAVGYAVGPAVWAGVTICVSFLWGAVAFAKPVSSLVGALFALVLLILGVCIAAASSVAPPRWRYKDNATERLHCPESSEELNTVEEARASSTDANSSPKVKTVVVGLLSALACGVLNGSLMVPMTCFSNGSDFLGIRKYDGAGIAPIEFLPSLAIGIIIVQPILFLIYFAPLLKTGVMPSFHLSVALLPGLLTGTFWGMGNFAAMFATTYLGQTIGFPLTQTCIIVAGLWGVIYYREISGPLPIGLFALACCVIIAGAYLNGTYA